MNSQNAYEFVEQGRIVAVMRGAFTPYVALETAETLRQEGINVFELTMNSTQPIEAMRAIKHQYGNTVSVGMGTVLSVDAAQQAIDAGADFVVSPAFQPEVVEVALAADVLVVPGVITPSEAVAAWNMGVKLLKLFPVGVLGVDYFKAMFGPLDHMKFTCNGGMSAHNVADFLRAGAVGCGMAGWLTGDGTASQDTIRQRARQLQEAVAMAAGIPRQV